MKNNIKFELPDFDTVRFNRTVVYHTYVKVPPIYDDLLRILGAKGAYKYINFIYRPGDGEIAEMMLTAEKDKETVWINIRYGSFIGDDDTKELRFYAINPNLVCSSFDECEQAVQSKLEKNRNGSFKASIWLPSMKSAPQEIANRIINEGIKPIEDWTFPTDSRTNNQYSESYEQKNNHYFLLDGTVYLMLDVNSAYPEGALIGDRMYQNGEHIAFPVEKQDMFFERRQNGNIYGVPNFFVSGIRFKDIDQFMQAFTLNFSKTQEIMNELERNGEFTRATKSQITDEKEKDKVEEGEGR